MQANKRLMVQASHLTSKLQLERSLTAILVNTPGEMPDLSEQIDRLRSHTDQEIRPRFLNALSSSTIDPETREATRLALSQLDTVRAKIVRNPEDCRRTFLGYTDIIGQILDTSSACVKAKTDRGIGKVLGMVAVDQSARESLSQIRGMIAASLSRDVPLAENQSAYITENFDQVVGFLDSPLRQLSNGMTGDEFLNSVQWKKFDKTVRAEIERDPGGRSAAVSAEEYFELTGGIIDLIYSGELSEFANLSDKLDSLDADDTASLIGSLLWGTVGLGSILLVFSLVRGTEKASRRLAEAQAAEAVLMRSLENQKHALDEHAIVSIMDTRGKLTYVNDRFCELSGYTREELIGQTHRVIKSPDVPDSMYERLWETIRAGKIWKGQIKNVSKDGRCFWVDTTIVPFRDTRGEITQYVAIRSDITAIKVTERRLDMALTAAKQGLWDWNLNDGSTYFNDTWYTMLGYAPGELPMKVQSWYDLCHPDDIKQATEKVKRHLDGETDFYRCEQRLKTKSGEWKWTMDAGEVIERDAEGKATRMVGVHIDIDQSKTNELRLEESERRFKIAVNGSRDGIWDWNLLTDRVYYAPQWKTMLGIEADNISDRPDEWISRIDQRDISTFMQEFDEHLSGQDETFEVELRMNHKSGDTVWMLCRGAVVRDEAGRAIRVAGSMADITEIKQAQDELRRLAEHDRLTGLPNRELLNARLSEALRRGKADPGYKFAVLFFDFDRFKIINDSLGHGVGDALLTDIARQFEQNLREGDTASRFGGDEFVVLLNDLTDYNEAFATADRLLDIFAKPHNLLGNSVTSTASIGLVTNESAYTTAEEMLRDADAAMYQAKEAGKARVVVFDQQMYQDALSTLQLEADLRFALERGELRLVYQPIISLEAGEILGFEALLRWEHPTRGNISPADFIPIAEDTGLIVPIGEWVMRQACEQLHRWNNEDRPELPVSVNVNLSMRQVCNPGIFELIKQVIDDTGIDPQHLKFEITESTIIDDRHDMIPLLKQIRGLGIKLAMDDFGTGHSSLGNLHLLPIDILKIDQSFIKSMSANRELAAVMQAIITLAHELGMQTVAEGIETADQLVMLQTLDCNFGQGYYFRKPLTPEAATRYLLGIDDNSSAAA